jgi:hypothetical protein
VEHKEEHHHLDQSRQLVVVMAAVAPRQELLVLEVLEDLEAVVVHPQIQEVLVLQHQDKVMLVELVVLVEVMTLVLVAEVLGVEDLMHLHLVLEDLVEMVFH